METEKISNGKATPNNGNGYKTDLQLEIERHTPLTRCKGYWKGNCPFPQHQALKPDGSKHSDLSFSYYENSDYWFCYSCPPNHETKTGKKVCSGNLETFRELMRGQAVKVEDMSMKRLEEQQNEALTNQQLAQHSNQQLTQQWPSFAEINAESLKNARAQIKAAVKNVGKLLSTDLTDAQYEIVVDMLRALVIAK